MLVVMVITECLTMWENYYDKQEYFDQHPYVVIGSEHKYYYEAMCLVIVPETTAFYRTSFKDDKELYDSVEERSMKMVKLESKY